MRGQTLSDTQLLLELVGEAYGFEDLAEYRRGILEIIPRVVPCDRVGYNEITPQESFAISLPEYDPSLLPTFATLFYENPLIERYKRTRDGRPYRISDVIDQQTFHRLALYEEVYRRIGVEWQVAFTLPARAPLIVGIALTRTRNDFTDREVQLLALARPRLMHAYRNAELWSTRKAMLAELEQGLDTLGQHIVVLDPDGRVEFATDGARRLLGDTLANRSGLTEQVREWISQHRDPRSAAEPLLLHNAEGTVLVRVLPNKRSDRREVLLLESETGELSAAALRSLGLTPPSGRDAPPDGARPQHVRDSHPHEDRATHRREAPPPRLRETRRSQPLPSRRDRLGSSGSTTTNRATANTRPLTATEARIDNPHADPRRSARSCFDGDRTTRLPCATAHRHSADRRPGRACSSIEAAATPAWLLQA